MKENNKTNILFTIIYICVIALILFLIWGPKRVDKINKYNIISKEEVLVKSSEEYINELLKNISINNTEWLYDKLDDNYKTYRGITIEKLKEKLNNDFYGKNTSVKTINYYKYNNTYVYKYIIHSGTEEKQINIIEDYPGNWTFTFDSHFRMRNSKIQDITGSVKVLIGDIYQDMEYIKMGIVILNDGESDIEVGVNSLDSIELCLDDGTIYFLENVSADSNTFLNAGASMNKYVVFNVPLNEQDRIEKMILRNVIINGEKTNIEINVEL